MIVVLCGLLCVIVVMIVLLKFFFNFVSMNDNGFESFTHPWEDREPWMKGLVGINIEFESFSSWRGFFGSWSMGSIEAICLYVIMGGISVLM